MCGGTWQWCLQLIISPCFSLRLDARSFVFIWHNKGLLFKVRTMCVCVHVTAVSHINYKPNTVIFVKKTVQRLWQWQVYFTPTESCLHSLSRRLFFFKSHNGNAEKIIIKTPAIDKYERESVKGTINGKRKRTEQKLWNPVIYGGENKNKWRISLLRSHRLLAS